MCKNNLLYGVN